MNHYLELMREENRKLGASRDVALALEKGECREVVPRTNVVWVNFRRSKTESQSNNKPPV